MGRGRGELHVLVVDDDDNIRLLIADVLTEADCRVFRASNGVEAVHVLESERVDLLITDYDMPGMNGLEVVRWCQVHLPRVATVLMTGHGPEAVAQEGWDFGALRIILKPFSVEGLLILARELRGAALTS